MMTVIITQATLAELTGDLDDLLNPIKYPKQTTLASHSLIIILYRIAYINALVFMCARDRLCVSKNGDKEDS